MMARLLLCGLMVRLFRDRPSQVSGDLTHMMTMNCNLRTMVVGRRWHAVKLGHICWP